MYGINSVKLNKLCITRGNNKATMLYLFALKMSNCGCVYQKYVKYMVNTGTYVIYDGEARRLAECLIEENVHPSVMPMFQE